MRHLVTGLLLLLAAVGLSGPAAQPAEEKEAHRRLIGIG
jgi:hypothetical protein